MKKLTFICVLFLGVSTINFAQSNKIQKRATELVEKLNIEIIKGDKILTLSDEQKVNLTALYVERLNEIKKLGKEASKEDKKVIYKKYSKQIFKEILTKKQMKARKKGKEEDKE
jgi:uncharacterized membrane protein